MMTKALHAKIIGHTKLSNMGQMTVYRCRIYALNISINITQRNYKAVGTVRAA